MKDKRRGKQPFYMYRDMLFRCTIITTIILIIVIFLSPCLVSHPAFSGARVTPMWLLIASISVASVYNRLLDQISALQKFCIVQYASFYNFGSVIVIFKLNYTPKEEPKYIRFHASRLCIKMFHNSIFSTKNQRSWRLTSIIHKTESSRCQTVCMAQKRINFSNCTESSVRLVININKENNKTN